MINNRQGSRVIGQISYIRNSLLSLQDWVVSFREDRPRALYKQLWHRNTFIIRGDNNLMWTLGSSQYPFYCFCIARGCDSPLDSNYTLSLTHFNSEFTHCSHELSLYWDIPGFASSFILSWESATYFYVKFIQWYETNRFTWL